MTEPVYVLPDYVAYTRAKAGEPFEFRCFGPRGEEAAARGVICPACHKLLVAGEFTTLLPIGPGDNGEEREKCREGRWYNAVAIEAHVACVVGVEPVS